MSNINQEIKLCYGESYGIDIQSTHGERTKMTMFLLRYSDEHVKAEYEKYSKSKN